MALPSFECPPPPALLIISLLQLTMLLVCDSLSLKLNQEPAQAASGSQGTTWLIVSICLMDFLAISTLLQHRLTFDWCCTTNFSNLSRRASCLYTACMHIRAGRFCCITTRDGQNHSSDLPAWPICCVILYSTKVLRRRARTISPRLFFHSNLLTKSFPSLISAKPLFSGKIMDTMNAVRYEAVSFVLSWYIRSHFICVSRGNSACKLYQFLQ